MATITPERLTALSPKILPQRAQDYAPALDAVLGMADLNTPLRIAHFMAQLAYESAGFRALVENLNYKAETLLKVFPNRVKTLEQAQALVAQGKEAIANAVYGNRADLGNTQPGDGYKYIGRGFLMITGRANYTRYATLIGQPLVDKPELLEQPTYAAQAAAAFWKTTNINARADADDINGVTRLVNGGLNGLDGRKALLTEAKGLWPSSLFAPEVTQVVNPLPPPPPPPPPPLSPPTPAGAFSRYFTLEELTQSDTAVRLHIDNTPPADVVTALHDTATKMDQVRDLLKGPVQVLSGYRSPKLNTAIGGSPHSAHINGRAVDFVCRSYGTPLQICQKIVAAGVKFDQLIQEGTWVHISFDPQMRNQVLTASFGSGKTTYRNGL
ncbi:D-Ala-D-Ala carboxypeptidase family metallohydrolase [Asticcacaulis solisilvae]|uniref:D-Ala-D-Ala carboxypeptidase family metallohydrolase n=1 Tax=Asticcacaulis solisilvae TaxID=1217274 RepID=UPI003FD7FA41